MWAYQAHYHHQATRELDRRNHDTWEVLLVFVALLTEANLNASWIGLAPLYKRRIAAWIHNLHPTACDFAFFLARAVLWTTSLSLLTFIFNSQSLVLSQSLAKQKLDHEILHLYR
jgi:uncharacterized protein involved in cysteine biosynthesis